MAHRPSPDPNTASRALTIIADDLTGACDTAIAFAGGKAAARVHLRTDLLGNTGICAFGTNTRDVVETDAVRMRRETAASLPPGTEVFKKVDSVFRGNTVVEIAEALRLFPADLALIAPAYPELGRRLVGGVLRVEESGGGWTRTIAEELRARGCEFRQLSGKLSVEEVGAGLRDCLGVGVRAVLCDAATTADMEALTAAAKSLPCSKLWTGSGGLAHACRAQGIDVEGPVAADTIFYKAVRGSHDLVVAMYHDQGHIPMKLLDFEATVNTSLGIPIIRTSVDQGTAFDIAGKNIASDANMKAAIRMAVTMAQTRRHLQAKG